MFEFEFLPEQKILRWRLTGFWTEETALKFRDALAAEMTSARKLSPRFCSLSDTRDFPVQSDSVMKLLASMSGSALSEGSRKFAILVSSTLSQLQAQRSFSSDRIRVFRDEGEAIAWLTEAPAATAAPRNNC